MFETISSIALTIGHTLFPYFPAVMTSFPHMPYRTLTGIYLLLTYFILPLAQTLLLFGHLLVLLRLTGSFGTFKSGFRHRLRDWPVVRYFNCIWYISWMISRGKLMIECILLFSAFLAVYWVFAGSVNVVRAGLWWGMNITQVKRRNSESASPARSLSQRWADECRFSTTRSRRPGLKGAVRRGLGKKEKQIMEV